MLARCRSPTSAVAFRTTAYLGGVTRSARHTVDKYGFTPGLAQLCAAAMIAASPTWPRNHVSTWRSRSFCTRTHCSIVAPKAVYIYSPLKIGQPHDKRKAAQRRSPTAGSPGTECNERTRRQETAMDLAKLDYWVS